MQARPISQGLPRNAVDSAISKNDSVWRLIILNDRVDSVHKSKIDTNVNK